MSESIESPTPVSSEVQPQAAAPVETSTVYEEGQTVTHHCARSERHLYPSLVVRALAEFAGTFFIIFVLLGAASWTLLGSGGTVYSTAIAAIVAYGAAALTFSKVSGGHFNPAVSLAAALTGKIGWIDALVYAVAQVVAGIGAAALMLVLVPLLPTSDSLTEKSWWGFMVNGFGENSPIYLNSSVNIDMKFTIVVELIGSLIVIAAVVGAMRSNGTPSRSFSLTTALAYGAATFITAPVTGASLNPARSTGVAIFAQNKGLTSSLPQLWVFWVVPLLAGAIVGLVLVIVSSVRNSRVEQPVVNLDTTALDPEQTAGVDDFDTVISTTDEDSTTDSVADSVDADTAADDNAGEANSEENPFAGFNVTEASDTTSSDADADAKSSDTEDKE